MYFLSHLILSLAYHLMRVSRNKQDNNGTQERSHGYWYYLSLYQVEIEHKSHAWRHEEETEVCNEEIRKAAHPLQFNYFQLEQQRKDKHTNDACRQFYARNADYKLAKSEATEKNETLSYHIILSLIFIFRVQR